MTVGNIILTAGVLFTLFFLLVGCVVAAIRKVDFTRVIIASIAGQGTAMGTRLLLAFFNFAWAYYGDCCGPGEGYEEGKKGSKYPHGPEYPEEHIFGAGDRALLTCCDCCSESETPRPNKAKVAPQPEP